MSPCSFEEEYTLLFAVAVDRRICLVIVVSVQGLVSKTCMYSMLLDVHLLYKTKV